MRGRVRKRDEAETLATDVASTRGGILATVSVGNRLFLGNHSRIASWPSDNNTYCIGRGWPCFETVLSIQRDGYSDQCHCQHGGLSMSEIVV